MCVYEQQRSSHKSISLVHENFQLSHALRETIWGGEGRGGEGGDGRGGEGRGGEGEGEGEGSESMM